ncbi:uroporphyrinogen-III synthase [Hyphococcus luteus]|uniref:uroporphyrinogen-III synthase n=1 Tax=Hyphococcus luteus TaxID=2058213 RepID=UPI0013FD411D|nr:uroporphyrinogen-III synthase [Marinicaulis flavus]
MTAPRVIVTRPEPDAGAFAGLCRAHGFEPIVSPVMAIEIEKTTPDLSGAGALAFTSANGVRAFAANSGARDLPVFAVGQATAEAAKAAGFADIHVAGGDVDSLAEHIASEKESAGTGVLHIAGEARAGDLVALLEKSGIPARRQTLYRAVPAEALDNAALAALNDEKADLWVSLFSPRTARLFVTLAERAGLAPALGRARAACLSEAVAEAAGTRWRSRHIAAERTAESLAALIAAQSQA